MAIIAQASGIGQETEWDRVAVLNPASEETFDSEACKLESLSEKEVSVAERE